MAQGVFSSISRMGTVEPFALQVARGQITGHSSISVFGYNPDLDTAEESIWPDGGTVPHPTVAHELTIVSTDDADTSDGTGARTLYLEGIDGNYNVVSETIVPTGTTPVNTTNTYIYVNQLYVVTAGSGGSNAGEITAKVDTTLYDLIAVGYNNRTTAHYCVPAGYTAYLTTGVITVGQPTGSSGVTGFLKQTGSDNISRVGAVATLNNGSVQYDFVYPYIIPEKNCITASAVGFSVNNTVSAFFNIILIKNNSVDA